MDQTDAFEYYGDLPLVMRHETYEIAWCAECEDFQVVRDGGSTSGFTGAPIYWTDFGCGHQEVDASADNLDAAR